MAIRVLSIDGGGIRGVGPAHLLIELDTKLKLLGKPGVIDSFDLFVGTSTGCIVAAALAAHGQTEEALTPQSIKNLYYQRGKEMFTKELFGANPFGLFRGKYKESAKGRVLHGILGNLTLGEIERNFMGTFYNVGAGPGPVFANGGDRYRAVKDNEYKHVPLWEAVNASSSAPIYFDPSAVERGPHAARGADGGVFANNPAMCAYVEARKLWPTVSDEEFIVASFGCGHQSIHFPDRRHWGILNWASPWAGLPLLEAMFDGQAQTVSYQMKSVMRGRFFRFDFDLDPVGKVKLDDTSKDSLDRVVKAADLYLGKTGHADLTELATLL